ncbi:MAG: nitrophenyl compound nitroreductase subunit ArsF family protein [Planctomycetota bacterium]|jgi:hypothetical protein
MSVRNIITVVLLAFVAVSVVHLVVDELRSPAEPPASPAAGEPDREVLVYYFHATARCATCRKIESYAREVVENHFEGVTWRIVNKDEPANEHFVRDFQLAANAVVLVERREGRRIRWKNLEHIWNLVGDKAVFQKYVEDETRGFLEAGER